MSWSIVFSIIIGLIGIDILIIVHEFGHYISARLCHVFVEKVQIGFGPSVYSKTANNGTQICFGPIPYGAFCRMDTTSLRNVHPLKKIFIYLSGPFLNIVLAVLFYSIYLCMLGTPFVNSLELSAWQCLNEFLMFFNALGNMITGQAKIGATLSGFWGASFNIGAITINGFSAGFITGLETALWITASVSVSLAFANLLPIPALDGGYIFIIIIEAITRHEFSERTQTILQIIGLILLLVVLPVLRFFL